MDQIECYSSVYKLLNQTFEALSQQITHINQSKNV